MRTSICFNRNWYFILEDDEAFSKVLQKEDSFRKLHLPHDWSVDYVPDREEKTGGGGGFAKAGIGWYRKHFTLENIRPDEKVYLYFEGIYMDSTVYVNEKKVGGHGYGYTSFYVDMTEAVKEGNNLVAVRVNNSRVPNSRWYSGSGIYRDVWLVRTDRIHFDHFGVRCATNGIYPEQNMASLQIRAQVVNDSAHAAVAGVLHRIYDAQGELVSTSGTTLELVPGECSDCMVRPTIEAPHLWTEEDPYLYTLVSAVVTEGVETDSYTCKIGVRTAQFTPDRGFLLNGRQVKIKGVCVHHDCGLTGAVGYRESWERRLKILKDMGCNGIRCSHNPPAPVLLELCDVLGFFVMDEIFDEWMLTKNKTDNYYSENLAYGSSMFFENHGKEDLTAMLRRDFNHPSVILWSIGNEIPEQSSLDGVKILRCLQDICHQEDSSRKVTSACDNIAAAKPGRTLREFENALDVVGYNYVGRWRERAETFYEEDRMNYPQRCMIGSENPSAGGIRGEYSEGWLGNYTNITLRHEALWRYTASHDFVAGDYLWTGIDYLGETRWPRRGAFSGPIDTAGFKKDTFYYFRSIWNQKAVTLHLAPHWNHEGQEGDYKQVICYTNCEEVKLYVNGKYVGSRGYQCPRYGAVRVWNEGFRKYVTTNDLHLVWDVVYEPGTLRAEGYIKGELAAVEEVQTTGKAAALCAERVPADDAYVGQLVQIEVSARDAESRFVPDACPMISCEVEGPARLVGMDAGDLLDLSLYGSPVRRMFNGLLLAAIMPEGEGEVKVTFTSEDGMKDSLVFSVKETA